jgi:hypothetical protein
MKKLTTIVLILVSGIITASGQCTCNYSYSGTNDTLTFTNLSTVSNAHYYWNFGDGDGSNSINPIHVYPDDGKYLVTLYGLDTVTQCVDVYQRWISVVKPDTILCDVYFTDTVINSYLQGQNLSTNCSGIYLNCNVFGPGQWYCGPDYLDPGWGSTLFMHGMVACTSDSINGWGVLKEYYKTVPFQFNSNINYQNCSPNFEVTIDYQPTGALVKLRAMNFLGLDTFWITGFGNGIPLHGHIASYFYPYYSGARNEPWIIDYTKGDNAHSCYVRGTQEILIRNPYYTLPPNCEINPQPVSQTIYSGWNAQFIISTSPNITKQWQQDAGLGWMNLTNAGPYSGVNTDTLTIFNVQPTMNNYHFRCKVKGTSGNCHNTSDIAILTISLGIDGIELEGIRIFPNPVTDVMTLILPNNISQISIEIYNLLGEKTFSTLTTEHQAEINIKDLPSGVYCIALKSGEKTIRHKFIKQ